MRYGIGTAPPLPSPHQQIHAAKRYALLLTRCYLLAEKADTVDEEQHHHLQLGAQLPVAISSLLCLSFSTAQIVLAARAPITKFHRVQLLLLPLRMDRRLFGQP